MVSFKRAPRKKQHSAPSLSRILELAVSHHEGGRLQKAEALYRQVLSAVPQHFAALNNLGNVLNQQARYDEALLACQQAVLGNNVSADACFNLGDSLFGLRRYGEAIAAYRQTVSINPAYAPAYNNLGNALNEHGDFQEAMVNYRKAATVNPGLAEAHYNLGNALINLPGRYSEAIGAYRQAAQAKPGYLEPWTCLAIHAWIRGDWPAVTEGIRQLAQAKRNDKFAGPFSRLLSGLASYRQHHPEQFALPDDLPVLYVLGDSHCLSPAHTVVRFGNRLYRVQSRIIVGCKAWHLANGSRNKYRYWFEQQAGSLPEGAPVVIMFGEIDCRSDEGIIRHHQKTGSELERAIPALVENYVEYVATICSRRNLSPVFHGVPAPCVEKGELARADLHLLARVILLFNQALAGEMAKRKFPFSDVYTLTNDGNGQSSGKYQIDKRHLLPPILGQLLTG